ncbi:beta-propeller fold lactonase family protein [Microbacterium sp. bgisy203]|uniref:beta-propeller fold lactonase family protein n=1 Tax=Microbacterium sp. bgisy203 TaxID=3413799 RepID=UPI003D7626C7
MRFWVGGYTADADGSAEGIGILHAGAPGDALASGDLTFAGTAAVTSSPSWVTRHPSLDVVYAAQEAAGTVQAFARRGDAMLTPLGEPVAVGEAVCHVAVAPGGTFLVALS